jgi:phage terminase Nu1 subunit (DNA packaging protein)
VHRNTLAKWIEQGCPVLARADRDRGIEWEIDTAEVVDWRINRAVENALASYSDEAGQISKDEADRRRAVANAITAEVAADEALKIVVSRHAVEADMAAFCQVLKTSLANASSKIASRTTTMNSAPEIEDLCHTEFNRAFEAAESELAERLSGRSSAGPVGGGEDQPPSEG